MADTLPGVDNVAQAERATCSRCGAELRHPDSVAAGLGPVCRAKNAAEADERAIDEAYAGAFDGGAQPGRLL